MRRDSDVAELRHDLRPPYVLVVLGAREAVAGGELAEVERAEEEGGGGGRGRGRRRFGGVEGVEEACGGEAREARHGGCGGGGSRVLVVRGGQV